MAASEFSRAIRWRSSAVWPSLLVMKIVWARAQVRRRFAQVPRGSRCSLPKGCWRSIRRRRAGARAGPNTGNHRQAAAVATEFFYRIAPAFHAVLVHEHDDVLQVSTRACRVRHRPFPSRATGICRPTPRAAGSGLPAKQLVEQPLVKGRPVWNDTA